MNSLGLPPLSFAESTPWTCPSSALLILPGRQILCNSGHVASLSRDYEQQIGTFWIMCSVF